MKLLFAIFGLACVLGLAGVTRAQGPVRGPDKTVAADSETEVAARHDLEVARQYFKLKKAYVAALSRAEELVAGYPTFSKRDEALYIAGMSSLYLADGKGKQKFTDKDIKEHNRTPEQLRIEAREYLSEVVNSYPQSEFRKEAEEKLKGLGGTQQPTTKQAHAAGMAIVQDAQPIMFGLVTDCTGSMRSRLPDIVAIGKAFVSAMQDKDEAFIVKFISADKLELVEAPTVNKSWLTSSLNDIYVEGGKSAMLDGVLFAAKYLHEEHSATLAQGRRALIVISDGDDGGSQNRRESVISSLKGDNIRVYTIGFKAEKNTKKSAELLKQLAEETGGKAYVVNSTADSLKTVPEILAQVRQQSASKGGE